MNAGMRRESMRDRLWAAQARWAPYLFLAPFVLLFAVFLAWPLGRSLVMSLYRFNGPGHGRFVGLDNYRFLLAHDTAFWGATANTLGFTLAYVCLSVSLSLGLAMLLESRRVKFRGLFRFAFFSTYLVGNVFVALLFGLMLGPKRGLANRLVQVFWPSAPEIGFLTTPALAMPVVLAAALWLTVGFGMVYFLAALSAVDPELYEAAQMDGAGRWARFRHITLPGIRPVMVFLVIFATVGGLQLFELPYVLFGGAGPNSRALTMVMWLFVAAMEVNDSGYASAIGWVMTAIILLVTAVQIGLWRWRERRA